MRCEDARAALLLRLCYEEEDAVCGEGEPEDVAPPPPQAPSPAPSLVPQVWGEGPPRAEPSPASADAALSDVGLDQHLRECPHCADEWQTLSAAWAARDVLRAPTAPRSLQPRVLAELQQRGIFRSPGTDWLVWLARGLAASTVLCYATLGMWLGWSSYAQHPPANHALSRSVAREWSRLPDDRSRAWLILELRPDDGRALQVPADDSHVRHQEMQ